MSFARNNTSRSLWLQYLCQFLVYMDIGDTISKGITFSQDKQNFTIDSSDFIVKICPVIADFLAEQKL